jgi:murein DD-endopeptidase MepM/ murein hydrolase activator NlpD
VIEGNLIDGNYDEGLRILSAGGTVQDNVFEGNGRSDNGAAAVLISQSTDQAPAPPAVFDNAGSGNYINGIEWSGDLKDGTRWRVNPEFPHVLNGTLSVPSGATLTMDPGAVVKSSADGGHLVVEGMLEAEGTAQDSVVFTSIKNDAYAGDTNGDGDETTPSPGDWESIEFRPGSSGTLEYAVVSYGGSRSFPMIEVFGTAPTITNSRISKSGGTGIDVEERESETAAPVIEGNLIDGNYDEGLRIQDAGGVVHRNIIKKNDTGIGISGSPIPDLGTPSSYGENIFRNNGDFAVRNYSGEAVQAVGNFWNATDASEIDDRIYDDDESSGSGPVEFQPFLDEPPDLGDPLVITSVEPDPVPGSDDPQPFTIKGDGFEEGANVTLHDLDTGETFPDQEISSFSPTEIVINSTFTTEPATWSVEVINPGGESSGEYEFEVVEPDPPESETFAYPISSTETATEVNDGDGWYNDQDFGVSNDDFDGKLHLGEDWNAESGGNSDCGSPVYAASGGTIVYAGDAAPSLGKVVVLRHQLPDGSKVESLYMHLESIARTSGNVEKREEIGAIGDADGYYPSCHLHFAIRLPSSDEDPDWGEPGPGYASSTDGWTDPSDFVDARLADGETPYTVSISARRITALTIPSYTGNFPPQNNDEAEAVLDALPNIQFSQDKVTVRARVELKEGRIQPVTDVEVQATYKGAPLDIVLNDKVDSNGDGRIDRIPLDANGREDLPFADVLAVSPSTYSSGTQGALAATASTSAHSATANETLSLHYAQHGTQERPFSVTRDGYIFENPTVRSWREYFRLLPELSLGEAMTAWGGYLQLDMGRCYGMSGTSGLYFANPSKKPFDGDTYDATVSAEDAEVLRPITRYQMAQGRTDIGKSMSNPDLEAELASAENEISGGSPVILGIEAPAVRHAILATKSTRLHEQARTTFTVYDSNHPGVALEAQYDADNQRFQYVSYDGFTWREIFVSASLSADLFDPNGYERIEENIEEAVGSAKTFVTSIVTSITEGENTSSASASAQGAVAATQASATQGKVVNAIVKSEQGQRAGYQPDGTLVNEIPGAKVERVAASETSTDSLTYVYVPENGEYDLTASAPSAGRVGLSYYEPSEGGAPRVTFADSIAFTESTTATFDGSDPSGGVAVDYDGDDETDEVVPTQKTELPVELTAFKATAAGDGRAMLTWRTASETNNEGFHIERSTSGPEGDFEKIGFRKGAGTTTGAHTYRFTDEDVPFEAKKLTYRLRQEDRDGNVQHSKPVEVEVSGSSELALHGTFPNPFQEQATVRYSVPERTHVRLAVYDALGRRVRTLVDEQQEGRQEASFRAKDLSSGTYFYRLEAGGRVLTGSVVLVR